MDVAIAGAHGQIARALTRLLAARGDRVRGLIRNPAHADDVREDGAEPVLLDLESASAEDVASAVDRADAVVFAAGAGPGSGAARKLTVDRDGAVALVRAAEAAGVSRYVIVSSVGAESPPDGDDVFSVYLQAKAQADEAVAASALAWTIVRPGPLTDDPATGSVRLTTEPFRDAVTREDVALVLAAVLAEPRSAGLRLYVAAGPDRVDAALASIACNASRPDGD
jgi:uncharacterized protein YbjT (DUF2867 family)